MKKLLIFMILFFSFGSMLNAYNLTTKDKKIVNTFIKKIEKINNTKIFKKNLSIKIDKILAKKHYSAQITAILKEVSQILNPRENKINIKKEVKTEEKVETNKKIEISKSNFNFEEVKNYWLNLTNNERKKEGLKAYTYEKKLEKTALKWSKIQKSKGKRTHKRDTNDSFYNYTKIRDWLKENGVVCKNVYRVTFTENVGSRGFSCSKSDCTQEVKNAITNTFNFYMSEKNKKSRPHYNSIMNKYFNYIGFGIELDKKGKNYFQYYLTVHYCTKLQ